MAHLEHVTDHADRAVARLLEQFRAGETVPALVRAVAAQAQAVEDALWDALVLRRLDQAEGTRLDVIGRIVGQPREGRSDAEYLLWLRARMLINQSSGRAEDIISVLHALLQGSSGIVLEEQFPAGLVVRVDSGATISPTTSASILNLVKAGGVRAILESATTIDTTSFAFDDNGAGFGDSTNAAVGGTFATAI
jgi:hypothetical protein